ncbi:MAG TPA: 5-demethoxyubiquinol-8 5-hydroxylase UbiM [Burkholderiales bacterium]|nr:5-demethoxyubiquinol-8 5-hydroxylase UbiM [Burkholderiales bacterium]
MDASNLDFDVVIIGAGPAGLALAISLGRLGLKTAIIEKQSLNALQEPAPDGREIALSHRARRIMTGLGMWDRLNPSDVSPIREARVVNGVSASFLRFAAESDSTQALGFLTPNHAIRKAAFQRVAELQNVRVFPGAEVQSIDVNHRYGEVLLANNCRLRAKLVVAADSRFSQSRRQMGIATDTHDFGRTIIVCRMRHEKPHNAIAHECFCYGGTLAILPLGGERGTSCSAVITVTPSEAAALICGAEAAFAQYVEEKLQRRLGAMQLDGRRHGFSLVAAYARRFHAQRFALVGDAAVGMHPVTAHGYNFGLYGVETLTAQIKKGMNCGLDVGAPSPLARYSAMHRQATLPIYLATNALIKLFTDDSVPARLARSGVLKAARHAPPFKWWVTNQLLGE